MLTDRPPRTKALLAKFMQSDGFHQIELPPDDRLRVLAQSIEARMAAGVRSGITRACADFMAAASDFYAVPTPEIRALAARPLRVREGGWATELFGDYALSTGVIRIWTRTAVRKQVTSFGTFLSTLCHEFCHHLDCRRFGFQRSPHTRGFYERAGLLYHHARGTPPRRLFWTRLPRDRWRIDWQRTKAQPPSSLPEMESERRREQESAPRRTEQPLPGI